MNEQPADSLDRLRAVIFQLEALQTNELEVVKEQLKGISERLTTSNLVKGALGAVLETKPNIIAASVGLSLGVLSKTFFEGATAGPLRKILGTLMFFGITKAASPTNIKSVRNFFTRLSRRPSENSNQASSS